MIFELEDTTKAAPLFDGWDAHNMISVHLAQKLGYEFSHEYTAYEVCSEKRTH